MQKSSSYFSFNLSQQVCDLALTSPHLPRASSVQAPPIWNLHLFIFCLMQQTISAILSAVLGMEGVAQLVEHRIVAPKVAGSRPVALPIFLR